MMQSCYCAWHHYLGSRYLLDYTLTLMLDRLFDETEQQEQRQNVVDDTQTETYFLKA